MAESYRVERPRPTAPRRVEDDRLPERLEWKDDPLRPRAVFVAHGMGQQVPFQTLDDVAHGLCTAMENHGIKIDVTATSRRIGCETLQRLELDLSTKDGEKLPPIHVYEAYWAPLTEGVAGLWNVVQFLLSGGWNGLRSDARLHRFMFGCPRQFRINRWHLTWLAIVILTIVAMLIIGGTIGGVAVARFTFTSAGWINPKLIADLTVLFEGLLGAIAASSLAAVALIIVSRRLRSGNVLSWRYRMARLASVLTLIPGAAIVLALVLSAYVAIPVIFLFDEDTPFAARVCEWCNGVAPGIFHQWGESVERSGRALRNWVDSALAFALPERATWYSLIAIGVLLVLSAVAAFGRGNGNKRGRGGHVVGLVLALLALTGILALCGHSDELAILTWLLLFGAVLFVRGFLIQFIGDVAIYVSPHVVDRFFDVRARIRTVVWRAARAVYSCTDEHGDFLYKEVVVVGHSLGSVVVYDVLNRLINEDDFADGGKPPRCDDVVLEYLDVCKRTSLLLTFGSPLDKTAFIFARHDPHGGNERDALAAAVQPLIARERSFPWINLWTRFDLLGGPLQFYDSPDRPDEPKPNLKYRVENVPDPQAITPLAAHTEFWKNTLMYQIIYDALIHQH
jgi:hypothetical protein